MKLFGGCCCLTNERIGRWKGFENFIGFISFVRDRTFGNSQIEQHCAEWCLLGSRNKQLKMKNILFLILSTFLTSCAVTSYYQVYNTDVNNGLVTKDEVVFEDTNCRISYNLWAEGGNVGFKVYNKSNDDLKILMYNTFFVLNGFAYEYFQNRTFSRTANTGVVITSFASQYSWNNIARVSGTSSASISATYAEKPELTIPPKTHIQIAEYVVSNERFISCNLLKNPTKANPSSVQFTRETSPFVFANLITYATKSDTVRLENNFFVKEIANYPSTQLVHYVDTNNCGKRLDYPSKVLKQQDPNKFFIKYTTN